MSLLPAGRSRLVVIGLLLAGLALLAVAAWLAGRSASSPLVAPTAAAEEAQGSGGAGEQGCSFSPAPRLPCPTADEKAVANALVTAFEAAGMPVARAETATSIRDGYRAQFNNLVVLLMALAGLTALVGGLGLGNTMALNVLELSLIHI